MAEEKEEEIEKWYFHKQSSFPDMEKWLCIDTLKACCPLHTWGPLCSPCPGDPNRPCFGNGQCQVATKNTFLYTEKEILRLFFKI